MATDATQERRLEEIRATLAGPLDEAFRAAYETVLAGSDDPGDKMNATMAASNLVEGCIDQARSRLADHIGPLIPAPGLIGPFLLPPGLEDKGA